MCDGDGNLEFFDFEISIRDRQRQNSRSVTAIFDLAMSIAASSAQR